MNIKLFKTKECYYVYDINKNNIIRVPLYVYRYLVSKDTCDSDMHCKAGKWIKRMQDENQSFLPRKDLKIKYPYSRNQIDYLLHNRYNSMTLELTRKCNLRCKYCFLSDKYNDNVCYENKSMSYECIDASLKMLIENSKDAPKLTISFYGGEPLLEYNKIVYVVNQMSQLVENRQILYNFTTNATLMTEEMVKFFIQNKFSIAISLDGPKKYHDYNRVDASGEPTFEKVMNTIKLIQSLDPEYFRTNVSFVCVAPGLIGLEDIFEFLSNFDVDFVITSVSPGGTYDIATYKRDVEYLSSKDEVLGKLGTNYLSQLIDQGWVDNNNKLKCLFDITYSTVFGSGKVDYDNCNTFWPCGACNLCIKKSFIDVDGNVYPCEKVNYNNKIFNLGNVYDGIDMKKYNNLISLYSRQSERCKDCWAVNMCTRCWMHLGENTSDCKKIISTCEWALESAMEILEKNPRAIDYFSNVFGGNT